MSLGDIWGASDKPAVKDDPFAGMSSQQVFEMGIREGKLSLMRKMDEWLCSLASYDDAYIMSGFGCTAEELEALSIGNPDLFDVDRLQEIYRNFKTYAAAVEKARTARLFT